MYFRIEIKLPWYVISDLYCSENMNTLMKEIGPLLDPNNIEGMSIFLATEEEYLQAHPDRRNKLQYCLFRQVEEPVIDTEKAMNSKTSQIKEIVDKQLDRIKEVADHCRDFEDYMSQRKNVEDMNVKEQIEDYSKRLDYWTGLIEGERAAYQQKHHGYDNRTHGVVWAEKFRKCAASARDVAERYQDITREFLGVEPGDVVTIGSNEYSGKFVCGKSYDRVLSSEEIAEDHQKSMNMFKHYPHVCPECGSPAYIGLFKVDCSNPDCGRE